MPSEARIAAQQGAVTNDRNHGSSGAGELTAASPFTVYKVDAREVGMTDAAL